ncbi:type VI secretion system PAAR protein [Vibrio cholerae]|uniref:type VI secretion system PAAR protein n=3 Tax=Vibrio TaxID=662 RepID=UPI00096BCA78|nr:type VI secretion system PAAR protein [Vibrio cholerae]EGR0142221.1 type VI secretion system PAAR protein [Vibrio cholerae]EGR0742362.1 type VI secretion system PAAR protein [Vibrio cholerae]EGR0755252.1 type VI secretion system PAAR protein [Vibrio cholerae]EGR0819375.1 type VI secretion system PAAR protein [Vibrio cholerae]EGR1128894.1 type VI secretion system PAAR protein [Vibrio cholerae]
MPGAARLGDIGSEHDCFPPTPIIAGSGDVFIDGKPAVRQGDTLEPHGCLCPKTPHGDHPRAVSGGSSGVFINGKPAARLGDAIDCGGTIASASANVLIG